MKKLFSLFIVLLVLIATPVSFLFSEAYAQVTVDPVKEPSKISLWFGKMKAKCEKAMEWVANSQVGQFVGDGIKYAKQGIAWAKEQYEAAMDLYNKTKDAILNSKEYKAAMISKDIAKETMKMKKILEERKQKLEEIEQQEELIKQQAQAKIANIQSNLELNEQRMTDDSYGGGAESFMSEQEKLLDEIQKETAEKIDNLKQSAEMINEDFKDKEMASAEKVADLSLKLKDTLSGDGKGKKETRSAKEMIQEQQDKLFLKAGEIASLKTERKKKKKRNKEEGEAVDNSLQVAMGDVKQKQSTATDKVESKEGVANTMTGESEVSGVNTEVLGEQLNIMIDYIKLNIAYIKTRAISEINGLHELKTSAASNKFDLCQYTDPENRKSALEMAKSKVEKAKDKLTNAASKVVNAYQKGQDKFNEAKNKVKEVSDTVKEGVEVAGQLGDAAGGIVESVKNNATSSVQGMF